MEPTNQFIPPKEEPWVDKLFQELENELDFGEQKMQASSPVSQKKHPLQWTQLILATFFKLLLVGAIIAGLDVTIRNSDSSEWLKSIPACSYYALGVEEYSNDSCHTYSEIQTSITDAKQALEKELGINLAILVPKKTQVQNVLNMPEVQFILQKTGNTRTSIVEAMTRFNEIKNTTTSFRGEDIECTKLTVNEKGELLATCDFYGFWIAGGGDISSSSRATALAFLEKLNDPTSRFELVEQPKSLEIEKYTSTDLGIRSTFATRTTLNLRLRYVAPNRF